MGQSLIWGLIGMGIGIGLGVAAAVLWRRRKAPAVGAQAEPEPSVPDGHRPVLDTHLVLNVLNRFAVQLTDDHLQDGLEALGAYLAAFRRDTHAASFSAAQPLGQCPEAYWRLTEWIHSKSVADWQLSCPADLAVAQRNAATQWLQRVLQSLEATSAQQLHVTVKLGAGPDATALLLSVMVKQANQKLPTASAELPWEFFPEGCRLTVDLISVSRGAHSQGQG